MAYAFQTVVRTCKTHKQKELKIYCFDCKKAICFTCSREDHASHACDDIASAARETRSGMLEQCKDIRDTILSSCNTHIENLKERESESRLNSAKHSKEIDAIEKEAISVIKNAFQKKKTEVVEKQKVVELAVRGEIKKSEAACVEVQRRNDNMERDFKVLSDFDVLEMNAELQEKITEIPKAKTSPPVYEAELLSKNLSPETVQILTDIVDQLCTSGKRGTIEETVQRRKGQPPVSDMERRKKTNGERSICRRPCVAAIDIGRSHSGYVFSGIDDWRNPFIYDWHGGGYLLSSKTPTKLLLSPRQEFEAFGYEAEDKYAFHSYDDDYHNHYFFSDVMSDVLKYGTTVRDRSGKEVSTTNALAAIIKFLVDQLAGQIRNKDSGTNLFDIDFVFTIPYLWNIELQKAMREAGKLAGLKEDQILFVFDYEAAVIYAQTYIPRGDSPVLALSNNTKFIVCEIGYATRTFSLRKVHEKLVEIIPPTEIPWGGRSVDEAFEGFLLDIIGEENVRKSKEEYVEDHLDLVRNFIMKKSSCYPEKRDSNTYMAVPYALTELMKGKTDLNQSILQSKHSEKVSFKLGKLKIKGDYFISLFYMPTINKIVNHLTEVFREDKMDGADTILLVGGLAESKVVQEEIKKAFPEKKVIIPEEPELATLKGAVYFGHLYS